MENAGFLTRLRQIRTLTGKTQTDFAKSMGIPRTSLINYEKGVSSPSADFLLLLREKYKISIDWFITGNGEMFITETKKHPLVLEVEKVVYDRIKEMVEKKLLFLEERTTKIESLLKMSVQKAD
ncbi:helix-turn-helix domain-containing protein [Treponema endosymbiont of Eucomonympha sp.]|uniref:helix-turn-helix domain-containing protein n=1 Tax=Treponema endosymbiont of Eucomonympha sp. TaxID=1580831 RepID=UPI0007516318|nr:helix-turn-helix transcriptional regulator [Treponema endosymbiont of Eucomonympha sp.]